MRSAIIIAALVVSRNQSVITGSEASFIGVCLLIGFCMDIVEIAK
jgi:hypothetical protein